MKNNPRIFFLILGGLLFPTGIISLGLKYLLRKPWLNQFSTACILVGIFFFLIAITYNNEKRDGREHGEGKSYKEDQIWFGENKRRIASLYPNAWVAVCNAEVVGSNTNLESLCIDMRKEGRDPVVIYIGHTSSKEIFSEEDGAYAS